MLTASAMRTEHIRTAGRARRACTCCADLRHGKSAKLRRVQRKRENRVWRAEASAY